MPESCISIIDELIAKRKEKRLTQEDLAKAVGVAQSVVARFENKKVMPQLDTILKIANALDCNLKVVANYATTATDGKS